MSDFNNLLTHYPLQELITIFFLFASVVISIWKMYDFFNQKYNEALEKKEDETQWKEKISNALNDLDSKIDNLNHQNQKIYKKQEQVDATLALVQERMQENSRSYLIDAHHKFCYKYKRIDDLNLQSIERRYLYYKTAGGNTFIDHLIEEIRSLPRVTFLSEDIPSKKESE